MSHAILAAADSAFTSALAESARGPERDGVFALWLVVRAAIGAAAPVNPARHAERVRALQARIRSLSVSTPLRRSLAAALADLAHQRGVGPAVVLSHLVAPAHEALGRRVADAVNAASRAVRKAT